jgi:DNA-directed RNA polymerase specialized sigma24 family protein
MALRETQEKLRQWGIWQRGGNALGYGSNVLAGLRGSGLPSVPLSDDYALRIDRVLAALKVTDAEQYRCIKLAYVSSLSTRAIGRELDISHRTAQRRVESAEHWLDLAFDIENI